MTRARSDLALGIRLGLCYDCSNEDALLDIAANIRSRRLSQYLLGGFCWLVFGFYVFFGLFWYLFGVF